MEPSLLEALGILSPSGDVVPGRMVRSMPAYKLKDPQECEEGCYWRWLVHTLLEDVAALKRNLEKTQEEFKILTDTRNAIEETIGHRDRLVKELGSMGQSLQKLREDVPRLREEHKHQLQDAEALKQRHRELHKQQRDLHAAIKHSVEWQRGNARKVQAVEREADEGRRQEKTMGDRVARDREKNHQAGIEYEAWKADYQALQLKVKELEEIKAANKAAKKAAKNAKK